MNDVLTLISTELAGFFSAADKREYLITCAEKLFDQVIGKVDLPGPDQIIDPLLRAAVRPLVGRVYDELIKKLEVPVNA
jgi:hypothetical protein